MSIAVYCHTEPLLSVAALVGQREQPQAIADQHVMLCHDVCSFSSDLAERSLSRRTDGPRQLAGPSVQQSLYSKINPGVATAPG
jgi:hypothetical protein